MVLLYQWPGKRICWAEPQLNIRLVSHAIFSLHQHFLSDTYIFSDCTSALSGMAYLSWFLHLGLHYQGNMYSCLILSHITSHHITPLRVVESIRSVVRWSRFRAAPRSSAQLRVTLELAPFLRCNPHTPRFDYLKEQGSIDCSCLTRLGWTWDCWGWMRDVMWVWCMNWFCWMTSLFQKVSELVMLTNRHYTAIDIAQDSMPNTSTVSRRSLFVY